MQDHQKVLATLRASQSRRILGLVALIGLGLLLFNTALNQDQNMALRVAMIVAGVVSILGAHNMWRGTASAVELTASGLCDTDGTVIAELSNIAVIDRGVFAFKPSNGFTIRLHHPSGTAWRLGLWWRMGKRIGVGGMTPAHHAKLMAERLVVMVNENGPLE